MVNPLWEAVTKKYGQPTANILGMVHQMTTSLANDGDNFINDKRLEDQQAVLDAAWRQKRYQENMANAPAPKL